MLAAAAAEGAAMARGSLLPEHAPRGPGGPAPAQSPSSDARTDDLERLFEASLDVMIALDTEGRVVTVNPTFGELTGTPPSSAVGKRFSIYSHPDDVEKATDAMCRVLAGERLLDFETRLLSATGEHRTISWRAVASKREPRVYAVGRDVTERHLQEQRLLRSQRLEAIGQLTGGIAHDFNNILSAILSYLEVARRSLAAPDRLDHALDGAVSAGRRGAALVAQLLTFARRRPLTLGPVDVNAMLSGMEELLRRTLGCVTDIRFDLTPALPPALSEPTQLELSVLNLCINARDALQVAGRPPLQAGGCIRLHTYLHHVTAAPTSKVDPLPCGSYVALAVVDNGIGMEAETAARAIEPFFTTKEPGEGTGLGLSQVFGIAKQCGGTMSIVSRPQVGTRVTIFLPVAHAEAPVAAEGAGSVAPAARGHVVLLVDDNPSILDSCRELLEVLGWNTRTASSGAAALEELRGSPGIDVVLPDLAMPDMTGLELAQRCQAEAPQVQVVLMTGYENFPPLDMSPMPQVLRKPFAPDDLVKALSAAVERGRGSA
jgi:PAS domain S-box-containing protein